MVTGHRPSGLGGYKYNEIHKFVQTELENIILRATEAPRASDGIVLISGMALGVDQWFVEIAIRHGIPFHAYIPFKGQESNWPEHSQGKYKLLLSKAKEVVTCSPGGYEAQKMYIRNQRMVDDADYCIAVWDGSKGGTEHAVHAAMKKGIEIYRIDPKAKTAGWMSYPKQQELPL